MEYIQSYPMNDSCRVKVFDPTEKLIEKVRHSVVI